MVIFTGAVFLNLRTCETNSSRVHYSKRRSSVSVENLKKTVTVSMLWHYDSAHRAILQVAQVASDRRGLTG